MFMKPLKSYWAVCTIQYKQNHLLDLRLNEQAARLVNLRNRYMHSFNEVASLYKQPHCHNDLPFQLPIFTAVYTNLEVTVSQLVFLEASCIKNLKPSINQRIKIFFSDYVMLQYIIIILVYMPTLLAMIYKLSTCLDFIHKASITIAQSLITRFVSVEAKIFCNDSQIEWKYVNRSSLIVIIKTWYE